MIPLDSLELQRRARQLRAAEQARLLRQIMQAACRLLRSFSAAGHPKSQPHVSAAPAKEAA